MGQIFVPKPSGAITVNPVNITGTEPQLIFTETDAPAGTGNWDVREAAGILQLRRVDAAPNVVMELVPAALNAVTMRIQPTGTLVLGGNGPTSIQTDGASAITIGAGTSCTIDSHSGLILNDDIAIQLNTFNGGIQIDAGSAGFGDVTVRAFDDVTLTAGVASGAGSVVIKATGAAETIDLNAGGGAGVVVGRFDASTVAGQTRFLVFDVDNNTLERVTVGAADSGGAGFKVLRIPN